MLRNYLLIALRTFRKHTSYTLINVTGLAVGMACCVLILLLVRHEWRYDRFHAEADRIHRVYAQYKAPDGSPTIQAMMRPAFTPELAEAFPAVEAATRFVAGTVDVQVETEYFRQRVVEVDSSFFTMFSFPLRAGNPATALADPRGMVVTEAMAETLFGLSPDRAGEALGRTVSIAAGEERLDFQVTGVAAPLPETSSLQFDIAISFENYDPLQLGGNNWGGRTSTYVLLRPGTDVEALQAAFPPFVEEAFGEYIEALRGNDRLAEGPDAFTMHVQPLTDLHLEPDVWLPYETAAHNPRYSYVLVGIGLLVLLIACINFMTLSVGRSAARAQEVGLRKVLGASPGQLRRQFWGEAFVLNGLALVLGLLLAALMLPAFNELTGRSLSLTDLQGWEATVGILGLMAVVGLVAGGYPAVVLARFQPATVLKGQVAVRGTSQLSRSLVVTQYAISIGLIICTLVMAEQLRYLVEKDLGYQEEQVVVVQTSQLNRAQKDRLYEQARQTLLAEPGVTSVARAGYSFTRGSDRNTWTDASGQTRSAYNFGVDYDYLDLLGIELVAGRTFSRDFPADPTQHVLVNEALVEDFGLENPVGAQLTGWLDWIYEEAPTIIGVVENFHYQSLHNEVEPAVLNMHPDYYSYMNALLVRVRPERMAETVQGVERFWSATLPGTPFAYSFLDDDLAQQYQAEQRWSRIITIAALLAILIACMGLFGLATLTVARRTKEIGIRKVLGASSTGLVALVAREFAVLVGVAALVAWPLAYLSMRSWLADFAFRIELSPLVFVLAAVMALLIALAVVGGHAWRAAQADPVQALRYE